MIVKNNLILEGTCRAVDAVLIRESLVHVLQHFSSLATIPRTASLKKFETDEQKLRQQMFWLGLLEWNQTKYAKFLTRVIA